MGYTEGYRASKQSVLGEVPKGDIFEDNNDAWSGDHCCDPSFVPGVCFGSNFNTMNMDMPDQIAVDDVSSLIQGWMTSIS